MKKTLFLVIFFFFLSETTYAQCYFQLRQEGITFFYNKKYSEARKNFELAKQRCEDVPQNHDLDNWINKCNKAISKPVVPAQKISVKEEVSASEDCLNDCYIIPLNIAIISFQSKNYHSARDIFLQINDCPCLPSVNDISLWIEKCNQMISSSDCIRNCYNIYYKIGEDFLLKENFEKACDAFTKAKQCNCTPDKTDIDDKINYCKKRWNDLIYNTLRKDSMNIILWSNKAFYRGDVQYGKANGKGECIFLNHSAIRSVKANFKEGIPHGEMEIVFITGERFIGLFDGELLDTNGLYIYANGDSYKGEYSGFEPNGKGEMKYLNGDFYIGQFEKGKKSGKGELIAGKNNFVAHANNCKVYKGEWRDDFKMGYGKCYDTAYNLIHEGYFKNDFPEKKYPNRVLKIDMEFIQVEKTTFTMGCNMETVGSTVNESPAHQVTLDSFMISKYEITVGQYQQFCKETGHPMPPAPSWGWRENHPIVNVSWYDALAFCEWNNCRLPTEAEWECAAKGGNRSKGFLYSGNDTPGVVAVLEFNSRGRVQSIGSKQPNELDIYDMSGNVSEWCHDYFAPYSTSSQINPTGPENGNMIVLRGGSWATTERDCRTIFRGKYLPNQSLYSIGFRVVKMQ